MADLVKYSAASSMACFIETAKREVLEETNFHIEIIDGFTESIEYILPDGEDKKVIFYLGNALESGNMIVDKNEIKEIKWFSFENAINLLTYENSKQVLRFAHSFLTTLA